MEILHIPNAQNQPPWMVLYLFFFQKGQAAMKVDVFSPQKMGMSFFLLILGMQSVQPSNLSVASLIPWNLFILRGLNPPKEGLLQSKTRVIWVPRNQIHDFPPLDVVNQIQPSSRPPNSPNHIFCFQLEVLPETKRLVSPFLPRLPIQKLL